MHSFMFLSPVNASFRWSEISDLVLDSAALLEVGRQGKFSSHIFPGVSITVIYLNYFGDLILQGLIQHLGCFIFLAYWPCTIWTVSRKLRSVLEGPFDFWMTPMFSEGFSKWSGKTCGHFHAIWIDWSTDIFLMLYSIVAGLICSFNHAVLAVFLLDSCLLFPWVKGAPKFLAVMLLACEWCPGKYSPCFLVLSLCDK